LGPKVVRSCCICCIAMAKRSGKSGKSGRHPPGSRTRAAGYTGKSGWYAYNAALEAAYKASCCPSVFDNTSHRIQPKPVGMSRTVAMCDACGASGIKAWPQRHVRLPIQQRNLTAGVVVDMPGGMYQIVIAMSVHMHASNPTTCTCKLCECSCLCVWFACLPLIIALAIC
jgi:hypothetical protein